LEVVAIIIEAVEILLNPFSTGGAGKGKKRERGQNPLE
jgi:hypothetical protein